METKTPEDLFLWGFFFIHPFLEFSTWFFNSNMTTCSHGLLIYNKNTRGGNMNCIYCQQDTEVYNTRNRARNPSVWRRRRCKVCVAQFSTIELPDYDSSLVVKGLSGKLYPFSRDKLFLSLHKALSHRSDALPSATALTDTTIGRLLTGKKTKPTSIITMQNIAQVAHLTLKRYDPLAAHTYKAYHQTALDE